MGPEVLAVGLVWFAVFLFSLTVHEASHALVAWKLGDPTAYHGGQVTLNPIPHIAREPFGTVVVPLLTYAWAGWMMGWASAPYDPTWAERFPRRAGWMALAGPVSNLTVALLAALAMRIGLATSLLAAPDRLTFESVVSASAGSGGLVSGLALLLSVLFCLNVLLFVFNLIPVPPLDGSSVLALILPAEANNTVQGWFREPAFRLLGLVLAWKAVGWVFPPVLTAALSLVYL